MEEWPTVRFGDVVQKMNGKIDLEERAGKLCVRGEHIPREFPPAVEHIVVDDDYLGPAFHRTFEAGDVLFATRFPNLNKVGQPSFSGICANTTLVLRTNKSALLQDFLPHIMKTKSFVRHCILNTRGSTNPYINWTQLADYEFRLPPINIQKSFNNIFSPIYENSVNYRVIGSDLNRVLDKVFLDKLANSSSEFLSIGKLLNDGYFHIHKDGNHGGDYPRQSEFGSEGVPFLSVNSFSENGDLIDSKIKLLNDAKAIKLKHGWIEKDDVLLSHNATVGNVAIYDGRFDRAIVGTSLTIFRCNKELVFPRFLFICLKSKHFQRQLQTMMVQSTRNQVPITTQRKLVLPIVPLDEQKLISDIIERFLKENKKLKISVVNNQRLYSSLIEEIGGMVE